MRRLVRWLIVAGLLIGSGWVAGWLTLRGSLPQVRGTVSAPALADRVSAERDALGSLTLHAGSRLDLAWALGYVHAQERFLQMDLLRRRAAGELAELVGDAALRGDRVARAHRMRSRLRQALKTLPDWQQRQLDAYRDGVNAGLTALRVRPFGYLLLRAEPQAWRSEDSLLVIAAMAFTLNDAENRRELGLAYLKAGLPEALFRFLSAAGGEWDAPLGGAALAWPELPEVPLNDEAGQQTTARDTEEPVYGSNAFAVSGALSHGAALIANDMHLDLGVPNIWFRARLIYVDEQGGQVDVSGASLPGVPAIVVGSNGRIAWGFTNSDIDTADWVRVERDPRDRSLYRTDTGWTRTERHAEIIHVKGAADETLEIEETRWGPILAEAPDGTPLALAWTAQEPGAINLELLRMERATSVEDALEVAHAAGIPPQNLVVGDRDGRIAWTIAGRVPRRTGGFDPGLPADWSAAGTGWEGWLDAAQVPRLIDPPDGRLWTANQRVVGGAALALLGDGGYDLGARAGQIRDDLRARSSFDPAAMLAIQLDDRALLLERWKDLLATTLAAAPESAAIAQMRAALGDWSGRAAIDSVAYRLVRSWRNQVIDRVLGDLFAPLRQRFPNFTAPRLRQAEHAVWRLLEERPAQLPGGTAVDWSRLLLESAMQTGAALEREPGGLAAQTWGRQNTARIAHPLSRALPGWIARLLDMPPDELAGDSNMPRVAAPAFGASERFAVAPGAEAQGYFMMPGGQSGHPLSPWYGSGHEDWVRGVPTPFLPGAAITSLEFRPR